MKQRIRRHRGFTLIEIMIVVAIIGILSAMAYPLFSKYQCRAKQAEAQAGLKALFLAQDGYRARNDHYVNAAAAPTILYPILVGYNRYTFPVTFASHVEFVAEAVGRPGREMEGDLWSVNHLMDMENLTPNHCN